ncbi:hypothetical protein V7S43_011693 [Phytophthora oleae]|uniref:Uncharacterized protein n=1 Tax=Phytophthora oleae TaxID=2107226 RepID=A0ABD3FAG8_9STRA
MDAEGDPGYAESLDPTFEWRDTVNQLSPGEDLDLVEYNLLQRNAAVDDVVIKTLPMHGRLRLVLARLGLPTLVDQKEIDDRQLDDKLCTDERLIHEAYEVDIYVSGSQHDDENSSALPGLPQRVQRVATGEHIEVAYTRILMAETFERVLPDDRPTHELFVQPTEKLLFAGLRFTERSWVFLR